LERKLTAILCADVFGYSRLMGENEEATLRTLSSYRKLIDSLIEQHRGRFVNSAGDSVLAEFASVVNAVQCAVEIQSTLKAENATLPPKRRMEFRIGVNLGDVMVDGEQIYGDGVNVAARLESLAAPGGICISGTVHEQVRDKLALGYEDAGEQEVKNIARPVRVWRVLAEPGTGASPGTRTQRVPRKHVRRGVFSLAGLALIAAVIVFVQHLSLRPPTTTASIPPAQSPALPLPNIPSIAVLPFTNMSGDREQEYFSDGMTDDIITALSRLQGLFVIDRNSAFAYKGKPVKAQQVSRELGVHYVLEGSVRKEVNQVRITAQLVDATTDYEIWAERYDRPLQDIFALQDEIVRKIVTTLKLQLTLQEQGVLVRKTTDNLDAYDDLLRGMESLGSGTKDANMTARQMFERAVALDPQYASAYASIGLTYLIDWESQWNTDPKILGQANELAQKAVALDDSLPAAHDILGDIYLFKRQHDQAIAEAERAIALDPNRADGYVDLALILRFSGRAEEALESVNKAMRLNPHYPAYYLQVLGQAYCQVGRYEDAITAQKGALSRNPNLWVSHICLAACYSMAGRDEAARAQIKELLRLNPNFSFDRLEKQIVPYKNPADGKLMTDSIRKAAGLK
jgi:TolB-like protein/class 3 adenylate cyclase/Tfp pilus assembly protein PilF